VGAVVLAGVASQLGVGRFVVSEWGLREGAILDALHHREVTVHVER
jgi:exopolyphosphatase/pppGpp-phosphohydrolase